MALMESPFKIILGSSSMPRQHILAEMGYDFTVMTADIDEKAIRKEKPEELVTALAEAKADAILSSLQNVDSFVEDVHTTLLITADTSCECLSLSKDSLQMGVHGCIVPLEKSE